MSAEPRARFSGFPDGRLAWTPIPDLFFGEVLPAVDDLDELKVTLHLLWRISRKRGYPRFATRRELAADRTLLLGLGAPARDAGPVLDRALARATERGTLLIRQIWFGEQREDCYFLNTSSGRRAIKQLEERAIDLRHVIEPAGEAENGQAPGLAERPNIFTLYEQNIGLLTPLIVDELRAAEETYPPAWIAEAFREAVVRNRRSWRYVERILERWTEEGRGDGATPPAGRGAGWQRR